MQGMTHRWCGPAIGPAPASGTESGPRKTPLHPDALVDRVLRARGVSSGDEAGELLDPRLTGLSDPDDMADVTKAADRLLRAARGDEVVVIYGDYDVDGVCASAILYRTLSALAPGAAADGRLRTYIPHRIQEGYGLNADAIASLADEGAGVIVSVDCGIGARGPAEAARGLGVDLIITDHHAMEGSEECLPPAYAVVHPARRSPGGEGARVGELCGAGVAFKLAWRLATLAAGSDRVGADRRELLLDLMALAGLATIADIVPLVGENRLLARFGLRRIKSTAFVGLGALLDASGLSRQAVGAQEAGFVLGPRLNACGRMGHAADALELLLTDDGERAARIASELDRVNRSRQSAERSIFTQALEEAERAGMTAAESRAIVLAHERWHPGVVGIVCSRLVGRFGRPAVLMQREGGRCRGSARGIEGFDLHAALAACSVHLETFGGHRMAAGLALAEPKLGGFTEAFCAHAADLIDETMLIPQLRVDAVADPSEVTGPAVSALEMLGPFGRDHPPPTLLLRGVRACGDAEPLGARGRHAQWRIRSGGDGPSREHRVVAWGWGERRSAIRAGAALDVVVRPVISRWNGRSRVELELRDARLVGRGGASSGPGPGSSGAAFTATPSARR